MSELDSNIAELDRKTHLIAYDQWHPRAGASLWKRLEIPGDPRNGTYINPGAFDAREQWNAEVTRLVSHRERLESWDERLGVAFAVEHYLRRFRVGSPSPKILEIGSWPMKNPIVAPQFDNTVIALLGQNRRNTVVGVDSIDKESAFAHASYTPPYFGDAKFIHGDFQQHATKSRILKLLGGNPHMIIGNMVFEKGLGRFMFSEGLKRIQSAVLSKFGGMGTNIPEYHEVAEELAKDAEAFLGPHGVLVISNRGGGQIPDYVHKMPLLAVYMDKSGKRPYAQVRGKIEKHGDIKFV